MLSDSLFYACQASPTDTTVYNTTFHFKIHYFFPVFCIYFLCIVTVGSGSVQADLLLSYQEIYYSGIDGQNIDQKKFLFCCCLFRINTVY